MGTAEEEEESQIDNAEVESNSLKIHKSNYDVMENLPRISPPERTSR